MILQQPTNTFFLTYTNPTPASGEYHANHPCPGVDGDATRAIYGTGGQPDCDYGSPCPLGHVPDPRDHCRPMDTGGTQEPYACFTAGVCTQGLTWAKNDGAGSDFISEVVLGEGGSLLKALDLDGDGDIDILAGGRHAGHWYDGVKAYYNDGQGGFTAQSPGAKAPWSEDGASPAENYMGETVSMHLDWALGDLDGDGDVDLVAAIGGGSPGSSVQGAALYRNVPKATHPCYFVAVTDSLIAAPSDAQSHAVALGDFDGDGDLDVMIAASLGANRLYLNDGLMNFKSVNAGMMLERVTFSRCG